MRLMLHRNRRLPILFLLLFAPLYSQNLVPWKDPSPHTAQFATMDDGVRLEVLDWGGSGRAVILLAGGGNTAHVFDNFAPRLKDTCHVYGITRRGYGASTYRAADNAGERVGKDVLAVMQTLRLGKPVLVGHSIGGTELSAVANFNPGSIAGAVYLDAGYPYAFNNGKGPAMKEIMDLHGPQTPEPGESDLASFAALQKWQCKMDGFQMPESELRQLWESAPNGRVGKQREFPGSQLFMQIMTKGEKYGKIPAPVLAVFAIPHLPDAWVTRSTDPAIHHAALTYYAKLDLLVNSQIKAFEAGVPAARVVRLRGMHYIFFSNEADVLREIHS